MICMDTDYLKNYLFIYLNIITFAPQFIDPYTIDCMNKIFFVVVMLMMSASLKAQIYTPFDSSLWHTNFESALQQAKQDTVPLIMVFSGSDWCKPCIKLHERVLVTTEFSTWAKENAALLSIDFPRQKKNALSAEQVKQNDSLAEQYNPNGVFPLVIILSPDKKILGEVIFHDETPAQFILLLTTIIQNNSK
jgi:hypothetical protein